MNIRRRAACLRRWRATWPAWRAGSQAQAELRQPETPGTSPLPPFLPHLPHKLSAQFILFFSPLSVRGPSFNSCFSPPVHLLHIVVDPHHLEPDPAFHFDADPDPTFHSDVDPDTTFQFDVDPDPTTNFFQDLDPPVLQNVPL